MTAPGARSRFTQMRPTVTLIRGDGIGPEVVDAALRALESAVVMLGAVALTRYLLDGAVSPWVSLGTSIVVGGAGYAGWLWARHGSVLKARLAGLRGG